MIGIKKYISNVVWINVIFKSLRHSKSLGRMGSIPPPPTLFFGGLEPKPHGVGDTGLFQTIQASVKIIDVITVIAESLLVEAYKFLLIFLSTKKQRHINLCKFHTFISSYCDRTSYSWHFDSDRLDILFKINSFLLWKSLDNRKTYLSLYTSTFAYSLFIHLKGIA